MEAYQPPSAESPPIELANGYRDQAVLHKLVAVTLLGFAALALVAIGLDVWSLSIEHDPIDELSDSALLQLENAILIQQQCAVVWVPLCYVCFGAFLFTSSRNARALDLQKLQYTPFMTIAWFFIPIALWFKPYSAVKELWFASSRSNERLPSYFRKWWAAWVALPLLERFVAVASTTDITLSTASKLDAGVRVLAVVLAVLAWRVVDSIYRRQRASARELGSVAAKAAA